MAFILPREIDLRMRKIAELAEHVALTVYSPLVGRQTNIWPEENELEIRWFKRSGEKVYTISCGPCGGNRLYTWQNGMRCRACQFFHSYVSFAKLQERIYKLTRWNDKLVEQIEQPQQDKGNLLIDTRRGKVMNLGDDKRMAMRNIKKYLRTL